MGNLCDEVIAEVQETYCYQHCFGKMHMLIQPMKCNDNYCNHKHSCLEKTKYAIRKEKIAERISSRKFVASKFSNSFPRYTDATLMDYSSAVRINMAKSARGSENIYCYGKAGTGKTHLAMALLKNLKWCNCNVKFVKSNKLLLEIKSTFDKNVEFSELDIIEKYCDPDQLIIDDIGAEKISEWAISVWYEIIDRRYCNKNPTIFTSNLSPQELKASYGERIASRVLSGISFELKGEDRRLNK